MGSSIFSTLESNFGLRTGFGAEMMLRPLGVVLEAPSRTLLWRLRSGLTMSLGLRTPEWEMTDGSTCAPRSGLTSTSNTVSIAAPRWVWRWWTQKARAPATTTTGTAMPTIIPVLIPVEAVASAALPPAMLRTEAVGRHALPTNLPEVQEVQEVGVPLQVAHGLLQGLHWSSNATVPPGQPAAGTHRLPNR